VSSYACGGADANWSDAGTRGTPTVDGTNVYTFSREGRLSCFGVLTGAALWSTNLNITSREGTWHFSSSPLVEGNLVIVNVGSNGTAVSKTTHAVVWGNDPAKAGYASPQAFTRGTQRTVVVHSSGRCAGVDPATGATLWYKAVGTGPSSADPIIYNDQVWVQENYRDPGATSVGNLGSGLLTSVVWSASRNSGENCRVLYNGYIYGPTSSGLQCTEWATGSNKWTSALFSTESSVFLAKDQLVILGGNNGNLVVARATPAAYTELYRTNFGWTQTWTCPTLANGRLYVRNNAANTTNGAPPATLVCYDVSGDLDRDGISDDWEQQYLGGTNAVPASDSDHDGASNYGEYVAGTGVTNPASFLKASISLSNGNIVVSYPTLAASGLGYTNRSRWYDLLSVTNLMDTNWALVPAATNVAGNNSTAIYTNGAADPARFYRVKVRLE
jgi:outer membrane protein assembly factor BamB